MVIPCHWTTLGLGFMVLKCNSSGEYNAKWNKSDRKSQERYDLTHVGIKLKGKTNKQTKTHIHRQLFGGY